MEIALDPAAQCRQVARHLTHTVVLAQLALFDRPRMVLVLLAAACIETPYLNRRARIGRDVHVAPGGRNTQRVYQLEIARHLYDLASWPLISESTRLRAFTNDPLLRHLLRRRCKTSGPRENFSG